MIKRLKIFNETTLNDNKKAYVYIIDLYEQKIVNCDSELFLFK